MTLQIQHSMDDVWSKGLDSLNVVHSNAPISPNSPCTSVLSRTRPSVHLTKRWMMRCMIHNVANFFCQHAQASAQPDDAFNTKLSPQQHSPRLTGSSSSDGTFLHAEQPV